MTDLVQEVKELIIKTLNLEDIQLDDIDAQDALFGDGLGLDSIDALELGLAVKNHFGIDMSSDSEEMRDHFYSVQSLAAYIQARRSLNK